jgi:hypothetical protein
MLRIGRPRVRNPASSEIISSPDGPHRLGGALILLLNGYQLSFSEVKLREGEVGTLTPCLLLTLRNNVAVVLLALYAFIS